MNMKRGRSLIVVLGILSMLLLSACGAGGTGGTDAAPTPTKTASQLLQSVDSAMKKLMAYHQVANANAQVNISGIPASDGSKSAQSIQETIKQNIDGDVVTPDQSTINLTDNISVGTQLVTISTKAVTKEGKLYVQNKQGVWYVTDQSPSNEQLFSSQYSKWDRLNTMAQKSTVTKDSYETIGGVKLRHLTYALTKEALSDLMNQELQSLGQLTNQSAQQQQDTQKLLNSIKYNNPTLDLWIDEVTSYVHQARLQLNVTMDLSSLVTPTPGAATPNMGETVDSTTTYSNFDKKVTITVPANAQPTDNILQALQ